MRAISIIGLLVILTVPSSLQAQKKVTAAVALLGDEDSLLIAKGKSFVVQLPVRNRAGDDWALVSPPVHCKFTQSMLGQAGMLPNQEEPKLMFFKAISPGMDSIRFIYRNPKAPKDAKPEEKLLRVTIQ